MLDVIPMLECPKRFGDGAQWYAEKRLAQLVHEVDSRAFADAGSMTFDELADKFLAARKRRFFRRLRPLIRRLRSARC